MGACHAARGGESLSLTASRSKHPDRLMVFDACRFVAGVAVVWFHSIESDALNASGVIGRLSVAFYTIMAMVFLMEGIRRRPERSFLRFTTQRLRRLYLPFLGWSALTGATLVLLHAIDPNTYAPAIQLNSLVSGTALPLWFIPFLLVGSMLLFPAARWAVGNLHRELLLAAACGCIGLTLDSIPWNDPPLQSIPLIGKLLELSWHRWSALYWGIMLAVLYARWFKHWRWTGGGGALAIMGLLVAIGTTTYQWYYGILPSLKVAGGVGLTLIAFSPARGNIVRFLARFAPLSFGLYLSHTLWIFVAHALANACHIPISWPRDVAVFILAVTASILSVHALSKHRSLQWLAGQETPEQKLPSAPSPATHRGEPWNSPVGEFRLQPEISNPS
jgi:peptidoglycan/LPS O-acetylase OafA/YrhL